MMSEDLQTAFILLGVGMITVFVVLSLVVLTGRGLISIVNRYFTTPSIIPPAEHPITPKKIAAISAAVEIFTQGQGSIQHIRPIDPHPKNR